MSPTSPKNIARYRCSVEATIETAEFRKVCVVCFILQIFTKITVDFTNYTSLYNNQPFGHKIITENPENIRVLRVYPPHAVTHTGANRPIDIWV